MISSDKLCCMSTVEMGISGWTYDEWRGRFYPPKLSHTIELEFAGQKLPSIEINRTFYPLQKHGASELYVIGYNDVYVYFNNDAKV